MNQERGRRDHYVQQAYLEGFRGHDGILWAFIVRRDCWVPTAPVAIGCEKGFYDFSSDIPAVASVDPIFSEVEAAFPIAAASLQPGSDWSRHRNDLVRYAAMQSARTPAFVDDSAKVFRAAAGPAYDPAAERDHTRALMAIEASVRVKR